MVWVGGKGLRYLMFLGVTICESSGVVLWGVITQAALLSKLNTAIVLVPGRRATWTWERLWWEGKRNVRNHWRCPAACVALEAASAVRSFATRAGH
jgi:hypothetical protein